ncbi:hypothetical protein T265_09403 [Opisthorchis viverrini]|uniref:Uncharacterized protein n=1 Tax=Opisthorchis viverrini TaxID=6198 RepID=A0A075A536_OPIVI|nr:hypothetical protein T265_09403 [Opisthorchis viverrini]KER22539.1 hypothetical protein T265_09403 [Opisthorchis viverrini]
MTERSDRLIPHHTSPYAEVSVCEIFWLLPGTPQVDVDDEFPYAFGDTREFIALELNSTNLPPTGPLSNIRMEPF